MRTNFVGRSWVSAITHTPASGPFGPVTAPAMSAGAVVTAWAGRGHGGRLAARPTIITWTKQRRIVLISPPVTYSTLGSTSFPLSRRERGTGGEDLPSHPSLMVIALRGDPRLGQ